MTINSLDNNVYLTFVKEDGNWDAILKDKDEKHQYATFNVTFPNNRSINICIGSNPNDTSILSRLFSTQSLNSGQKALKAKIQRIAQAKFKPEPARKTPSPVSFNSTPQASSSPSTDSLQPSTGDDEAAANSTETDSIHTTSSTSSNPHSLSTDSSSPTTAQNPPSSQEGIRSPLYYDPKHIPATRKEPREDQGKVPMLLPYRNNSSNPHSYDYKIQQYDPESIDHIEATVLISKQEHRIRVAVDAAASISWPIAMMEIGTACQQHSPQIIRDLISKNFKAPIPTEELEARTTPAQDLTLEKVKPMLIYCKNPSDSQSYYCTFQERDPTSVTHTETTVTISGQKYQIRIAVGKDAPIDINQARQEITEACQSSPESSSFAQKIHDLISENFNTSNLENTK